jgi:hypothetical protein
LKLVIEITKPAPERMVTPAMVTSVHIGLSMELSIVITLDTSC